MKHLCLSLIFLLLPGHGFAEPGPAPLALTPANICAGIERVARVEAIPAPFLARLIWAESRFNHLAISPKGAQGIAQFMPGTAKERGLGDPFDAFAALAAAADFIAELTVEFGNLGLAAAAYNAGPARVRRWLAGHAGLPFETQNHVFIITGITPEAWRAGKIDKPDFALDGDVPFAKACVSYVKSGRPAAPLDTAPVILPWGVQVAAHFSQSVALASFSRAQKQYRSIIGDVKPTVVRTRAPSRGPRSLYAARIGARTRGEAEKLCSQLRAAGGACMVMRN